MANALKDNVRIREQHNAVRNNVGWYLWTHKLLEMSGPDATAFLELIFPNPIGKTKVGRMKYTTMLNEEGVIIDDLIVFRLEENKYWISNLFTPQLIGWLDMNKGSYDVAYKDISNTMAMYAIQGPNSKDMMNDLLAENVDDQKFYTFRSNKAGNIPVVVARTGYTGELGYEVYVSANEAEALEAMIAASGKKFNAPQLDEIEAYVLSLPTEKGFVLMSDLRGANPFEAGFDAGIDWSKDFIGKGALEKIKEKGATRKLLGFTLDDPTVRVDAMNRGQFGDPLVLNGEVIGRASKFTYSYTTDQSIGFALIDTTKAKVGDRITINGNLGTITERVFC